MDGDEVRRNLIVVAASVLLYSWLDLPPALITKKVLGENAVLLPWKVWIPLLVVLLYQAHRYWAVTSRSEEWRAASEWFNQKLREQFNHMAAREATTGTGG